MSKPYEDIGKDAVEFVAKGFPNGGTFKAAVETKTPNGVNLKTNATRSLEYKKGAYTEKISAELEPKWEWKENNVEFSGKLAVAGEFEGGVSFTDVATSGTKLTVTGYQSDKDGAAVKGQLGYKHPQFSGKFGAKVPFKKNTHINYNGEVTIRHENIHGGVDIRHDKAVLAPAAEGAEKPKEVPTDRTMYNVKLAYLTDELQVVGFVENQVNKDAATSAKTPIYHLFNMNFLYTLSAAIKLGFGVSVERNNAKGVEIAAAGEYKVDKDTSFKGKFSVVNAPSADDREMRLGIALKQNVTERVNVTVGADLNARAILGTPGNPAAGVPGTTKPHSFGFEVKFQ